MIGTYQTRPRSKGKPPKVTEERVTSVADYLCKGLPLTYALAVDSPVIPLNHWNEVLQRSTVLSAIYEQRVARNLKAMLEKIGSAECLRKMPPEVWIVERRFREHFGQDRSPSHVTINQTVIGISQDIANRGAELLRRKTPEEIAAAKTCADVMRANHWTKRRPGRPKNNGMDVVDQAIDVQATTQPVVSEEQQGKDYA